MLSSAQPLSASLATAGHRFESTNKQYSDVAPPICAHACVPDSNRRHKRSKATFGNLMTSPKGVNTNTPLPNSSSVTQSTNSRASRLPRKSCCHSRIELSQLTRRVMTCESSFLPPNLVFCTANTKGMLRNQGSVVRCCDHYCYCEQIYCCCDSPYLCFHQSCFCCDKCNFLDTLDVICLAH